MDQFPKNSAENSEKNIQTPEQLAKQKNNEVKWVLVKSQFETGKVGAAALSKLKTKETTAKRDELQSLKNSAENSKKIASEKVAKGLLDYSKGETERPIKGAESILKRINADLALMMQKIKMDEQTRKIHPYLLSLEKQAQERGLDTRYVDGGMYS